MLPPYNCYVRYANVNICKLCQNLAEQDKPIVINFDDWPDLMPYLKLRSRALFKKLSLSQALSFSGSNSSKARELTGCFSDDVGICVSTYLEVQDMDRASQETLLANSDFLKKYGHVPELIRALHEIVSPVGKLGDDELFIVSIDEEGLNPYVDENNLLELLNKAKQSELKNLNYKCDIYLKFNDIPPKVLAKWIGFNKAHKNKFVDKLKFCDEFNLMLAKDKVINWLIY